MNLHPKVQARDLASAGQSLSVTVPALADLKALTSTPASVITQYRTTAGDGGGGTWVFRTGNQSANVTADTRNAVWVPPNSDTSGASGAWQRQYDGPINVLWAGAVADWNGTTGTDNTAAINGALALGQPVYVPGTATGSKYKVLDRITIADSQPLTGDGRTASILVVPSTFNLSATGVVKIGSSGQPGGSIQGIGIYFIQPDTSTRASLVAYPPAIDAIDMTRCTIDDVRITAGMVGIKMTGNAGGSRIGLLESSCFQKTLYIDGAQDTIYCYDAVHIWPFSLTSNQQSIFYDASTVGLDLGRVDSMEITSLFALQVRKAMNVYTGVDSLSANVRVSILDLDSDSCVVMSDGRVEVATMFASATTSTARWANITGGSFQVAVVSGLLTTAPTNPLFYLNPTSLYASLNILGGVVEMSNNDATLVYTTQGSSPLANFYINLFVRRDPNIAYTNPTVQINKGRGTIAALQTLDKGTGAGTLLQIDTDDYIGIGRLIPVGWTVTLPSPRTKIDAVLASSLSAGLNANTFAAAQTLPAIIPLGAAIGIGGTTSSYGGLRWNGGFVEAVLADASAYTYFQAAALKTITYTVATLPVAGIGAGTRAWVTDATQTLTAGIGATVTGGGANSVPVVSDGTNWRIG